MQIGDGSFEEGVVWAPTGNWFLTVVVNTGGLVLRADRRVV